MILKIASIAVLSSMLCTAMEEQRYASMHLYVSDADKAALYTKLFQATAEGRLDDLKKLLKENMVEAGQVKGERGATLLHEAALFHQGPIITYLLELGLDPLATDSRRDTPFHYVAQYPKPYPNSDEIFDLLLKKAPDGINARGENAAQPLHRAVSKGIEPMIKYLLKKGAKINATDANNKTPLDRAFDRGFYSIVKILLDAGAKTKLRNYQFVSTLALAKRTGNEGIINAIKTAMLNDKELMAKLKSPCALCHDGMTNIPDNDFDKVHELQCCNTIVHELCLSFKGFYQILKCPLCKKNPTELNLITQLDPF